LYSDARKEDTKQDIVQANNEQKHDTGKREHLEEHISKPENDDILHLVLENNQNNIEARANIVKKNVLLTEKEQVEYSVSESYPAKQKSSTEDAVSSISLLSSDANSRY
jgi:hypothetical protein